MDHLGAILGHLGAILEDLGGVLGPLGGDLEAPWRDLGPSWGILGTSWGHLGGPGRSWRSLGAIFEACELVYENLQKVLKIKGFSMFLMSGGSGNETMLAYLGHLGGILGASWGHLGLSWAILGHLGAILGPSWGHLGAS